MTIALQTITSILYLVDVYFIKRPMNNSQRLTKLLTKILLIGIGSAVFTLPALVAVVFILNILGWLFSNNFDYSTFVNQFSFEKITLVTFLVIFIYYWNRSD